MRFEAVERVSSGDSERVLVVLEQQLRKKVVAGVERDGSRIILSGLGPSPRTINPSDQTVIEVRAGDGETVIDVESTFQASSLLGPVGQEEIVRGKLLRALGATRQQLAEEQDWMDSERRERFAEIRPLPVDSYKTTFESSSQNLRARQASEPTSVKASETPAAEVKEKTLPRPEMSGTSAAQDSQRSSTDRVKPTSGDAAAVEQVKDSDEEDDPAEPNRRWMRWAAIAACVLAVMPFAWRYRPQAKTDVAPVVDLSQSAAAGAGARPTPPAKAGPEEALRQWELTMRSGDAGAQSAYYAVPVQQYMWKHNVTRRDLETIKQKEISQRHGTWTMTMENVDIKRQGDTADVTFVKHITEQPQGGGQPRERRIHSKLTMKNSLGIWWIISERDIYPNKQVASDGDEFNPDEGETPSWAQPAPAAVATGATPSSASPN